MNRTWPQRLGVQVGLAFVCFGLVACSQTVRVPGHIVMQSVAPNAEVPNPVMPNPATAKPATANPAAASPSQTNIVATSTTATDGAQTSPQTVAVSVTSAPVSSAATPVPPSSLAGFQTGAAEVVMAVEPASKQVRELMLKQADKKLVVPLENARWQRGSIVLQLQEHHGSFRLNWLDDSAPFDRITHESCTYSDYCEHEVEVEEEYCPDAFDDKSCYKRKVMKKERGFYTACPGVQHIATTLQYSHAILSVELTDSNNLQLTFSGSSISDLFELAKRPLGSCKAP
ncbi:MAG TPA: hypothetical protein DCS87_05975 [Rheinheimera sp.]|nr:hypothetical protein [Rheinheimera sp.]